MPSSNVKYIGLYVHTRKPLRIAVLDGAGKLVMESIVETSASTLLDFLHGLRGNCVATLKKGRWCTLAVRRVEASRCGSRGLQSAPQRLVERRQQKRQGGRAEAGRAVTKWNAARGLPRRKRTAGAPGVSTQLRGGQQRRAAGDEPAQSTLSRLGRSLQRRTGLWPAPSRRVAKEDQRGRGAPPRRAVLSAAGCIAGLATHGARRTVSRESETSGGGEDIVPGIPLSVLYAPRNWWP